jgi:hypothetical protein
MAEHGELEYATATGNDYPEHEGTYDGFLHLVVIAIANTVTLLLGLTVGGVLGHWFAAAVIIVFSVIGTLQGLMSGSRGFSVFIMFISFIVLALYGLH